ncbi:hypothetical protein BDY21DRAFT_359985 [Lineolata rhizophorae]|uniref:Uncharacterized protein n=1 Tax=Lineolata rhizophorae TaxID=578093 RepID=A0A6A6PDX8_9PEZI|nr:hypothetical protein BDY21DRAFT_359985 [Lineolata rhizophorae]
MPLPPSRKRSDLYAGRGGRALPSLALDVESGTRNSNAAAVGRLLRGFAQGQTCPWRREHAAVRWLFTAAGGGEKGVCGQRHGHRTRARDEPGVTARQAAPAAAPRVAGMALLERVVELSGRAPLDCVADTHAGQSSPRRHHKRPLSARAAHDVPASVAGK